MLDLKAAAAAAESAEGGGDAMSGSSEGQISAAGSETAADTRSRSITPDLSPRELLAARLRAQGLAARREKASVGGLLTGHGGKVCTPLSTSPRGINWESTNDSLLTGNSTEGLDYLREASKGGLLVDQREKERMAEEAAYARLAKLREFGPSFSAKGGNSTKGGL